VTPSHIVPVMVGDAVRCKQLTDALMDDYDIYVQPINYPIFPGTPGKRRSDPSEVRHGYGAGLVPASFLP